MPSTGRDSRCVETTAPLEASVLIDWRAPYVTGHQATVPAGVRLFLPDRSSEAGSTNIECTPIAYTRLERRLVPESTRRSGRYGGYWLSVEADRLAAGARPFDPRALGSGSVRQQPDAQRALTGSLLGTAVGDAIGLPFEGMSRRRVRRLYRHRHQ